MGKYWNKNNQHLNCESRIGSHYIRRITKPTAQRRSVSFLLMLLCSETAISGNRSCMCSSKGLDVRLQQGTKWYKQNPVFITNI